MPFTIMDDNSASFESKLPIIDRLLSRKKGKWTLTCVASLDFDDVCQIIRLHIYKKWKLWDQSQPLENWVSKIISNQIANLLRNNYLFIAPPCSKCSLNQGAGLCGFTKSGSQCGECPLYKKWEKNKKAGYNMKLAESIDNADSEASFKVCEAQPMDWPSEIKRFHLEMKERLPPDIFPIYSLLYLENKSDLEVAKFLNFKTSEKGRMPGYKQIYNIKKKIIEIAREVSEEFKNENY